jgi:hydrophobe/amphiphile efflux-1 (HAE1) family protein
MSLNVSAWAIRTPAPSIVLFIVLFAAGVVAFTWLPVTEMPNVDLPVVSVSVRQAGSSPDAIETQITRRVEAAIAGISGVKHIESTVADSASSTMVEFELGTPIDRAMSDVRDAVSSIRGDLPQTSGEPVVTRGDVAGGAIATYAISSPSRSIQDLSWFIDDAVARALQGVRGVAQVRREGGADREIRVLLDPERLQAFAVTVGEINDQIVRTNVDHGGGRGQLGGQEQAVRTLAGARAVSALASTRIILPGGRHVALSDLGEVIDGPAQARSAALLNGEPVIAFGIYRAKGYSDWEVAKTAEAALAKLRSANPDVAITPIDSTIPSIDRDYDAAMATLVEGTILAIVVVFLFLRDVRATLISAVAIPLSILPTFFVMQWLGFSLNTISLLAITLATGVLVDDAIVELENIVRHIRMGKTPYRAAMEAADEIGLAVVATTATIIAVFVPVSFMGGIVGQYFKQFGITIAVAVFFSLLVARLITPLMAAHFLKERHHSDEEDGVMMRSYVRVLIWTVRRRFLTAAFGLAVFAGTVGLAALLPSGLFPEDDEARSELNFELPPGATVAQVVAAAETIMARLRARPEVVAVYASVGTAPQSDEGPALEEVRKGRAIVLLKARPERSIDQRTFERQALADLVTLPDMRMNFKSGMGGREFSIAVSGDNAADVERAALTLERAISGSISGLPNVASTVAMSRSEIQIVPDLDKAADAGVTPAAISETVRLATIGDTDRNLAQFSAADRRLGIRVQLAPHARLDPATFHHLRIRSQSGAMIPLGSVAEIKVGAGSTTINRYDRQRRVTVEADLAPGIALGDALAAVRRLPEMRNLPPGVAVEEFGDAELMQEVFSAFAMAMAAGLLMVLAVLVLLFADFLQPVTILLSLPLSVVGAFMALLVTGNAMTLPVVIGLLMLMGIVTKNAILLVDFAIEAVGRGSERTAAVIEAGRKRARPIVMTTIAMSAGMVPSALALSDGGAFRTPMAIVVIGGLASSTVLSLIFVPSLFTIIDDAGMLMQRVLSPLAGCPGPRRLTGPETVE